MFLLCSLLSMNLSFANSVGYTQFAECKGEMMDGGTMVPAKFTLLVEDDFFCSKETQSNKGLIMDHSNDMLSALEATVQTTSGGVIHISSFIDVPELGRTVEFMKFDFMGTDKAILSVMDFQGETEVEVVTKYEFTCKTSHYHSNCE